jgi:hypothetical protein
MAGGPGRWRGSTRTSGSAGGSEEGGAMGMGIAAVLAKCKPGLAARGLP